MKAPVRVTHTKNQVILIARTTRRLIKILSALLVVLFGWLKLKGIPIAKMVGTLSPDFILRAALILNFMSWIYGTVNDINYQEIVYAKAPNQGRLPKKALFWIFLLAIAFGALCFVKTNWQVSVVLLSFWIIHFSSWHYFARHLIPSAVEGSLAHFRAERDVISIIKLQTVRHFLSAPWQLYRFIFGGCLAVTIASCTVPTLFARIQRMYSGLSQNTCVAILVFAYVISIEGWIWVMRLKCTFTLSAVDLVLENQKSIPKSFPRRKH